MSPTAAPAPPPTHSTPPPTNTNVAASPPNNIEISLKIVEIDSEVYAANKDKFDAAVQKGDFTFLNKSEGVSLLSAPSVTTRPGMKAGVEIVREMAYPTSFEAAAIVNDVPVSGKATTVLLPPTPSEFVTKEVGVSADLVPTVRDHKIELFCVLHITDFEGFTESNQALKMPVFETREVNLLEEFDQASGLKGTMVPGDRFDEETVTHKNMRSNVLTTKTKIVKKKLVVFLSAKMVSAD